VRSYFDSIDCELLLKAVRKHTDCPWVLLYIERWLKAPVRMEDGRIVPRMAGTPQSGVVSPCLANKDANRRGDYPIQSFDFLGYEFRPRSAVWHGSQLGVSFLPAASPRALKAIRQTVRRWALHRRSDKALDDLARMFNPYISGWINYYGHFYKSALLQTLRRIDAYLIRWGRYKYKRLRVRTAGARDWFARVVRAHPALFVHWRLLYVGGRTSGAV
jgi:RNA-directed DNA polymerase